MKGKRFALNISSEQREKISLALKVVVYFFVLVWDMLFILTWMRMYEPFKNAFTAGGEIHGVFVLLPAWYLITMVLISAWIAIKGFQAIGKWEYPRGQRTQPKK